MVAVRRSGTVVRGSAGLFYDRVPLRALANALLSAGNSTDLDKLRQVSVSLSPAQTGAPVFPNILPAAVPSVTLVNLATMDRNLQNAYSRQASVEVEQQLGERMTLGLTYQYLQGTPPADGDQPECAGLCCVRRQQWLPPESELRKQQPVIFRRKVELSRAASIAGTAAGALGPLPGLVRPVEIDEQPRRILLQLADRPLRPLEGLGTVRRRPAASSRGERNGPVEGRPRRRRHGSGSSRAFR